MYFNLPLIFINLYQRAKNQTYRDRDIVDLKTLPTNWPRAFWSISQEPDFPPNMAFMQEYSKQNKLSL